MSLEIILALFMVPSLIKNISLLYALLVDQGF